MRLTAIPARGGSKRIPRKNIKLFCGKPMTVWSIDAALQSGCFDQVVVSTDDAEIADVARQYGAQIPFIRPAELSDDYTGTTAVIAHAINWFMAQSQTPEKVCSLYTRAPFFSVDDLRSGLALLTDTGCDFAYSGTSYAFPIKRAIRINKTGYVEMLNPENFNTRSQDLDDAYHGADQFYWGRVQAWLKEGMIFGPASVPVLLPRHRAQDIDTPEDWVRAELMFKALGA